MQNFVQVAIGMNECNVAGEQRDSNQTYVYILIHKCLYSKVYIFTPSVRENYTMISTCLLGPTCGAQWQVRIFEQRAKRCN